MPDVVGVRFRSCGKVYDFEANGLELKEGDSVVVESDFGVSIGTVVRNWKSSGQHDKDLKKVMRLVTDDDLKTREENKKLEKEARAFCMERIMARGLPMKLVGAESTLDRKRVIFYFTADGRIDFRELVKDLAAKFKTRIEMRQIGVRDEAKLLGGFGICGRELCCSTFLTAFDPVSIKMAKKQELVLNVGKLSGLCSRLMCCLRYEYDGDLENIGADDVIPIGADEAPISAVEERIVHPKWEGRRHGGAQREHERRKESGTEKKNAGEAEKIAEAEPSGQTEKEGAPQQQPAQQQHEKKHGHSKKRRRFRR